MATVSKFKNIKDTSLSTIVEYLKNNNEIPVVNETEPGSGYNLKNNNLHEAAYDAYITGLSFLAMCKILGKVLMKL